MCVRLYIVTRISAYVYSLCASTNDSAQPDHLDPICMAPAGAYLVWGNDRFDIFKVLYHIISVFYYYCH